MTKPRWTTKAQGYKIEQDDTSGFDISGEPNTERYFWVVSKGLDKPEGPFDTWQEANEWASFYLACARDYYGM